VVYAPADVDWRVDVKDSPPQFAGPLPTASPTAVPTPVPTPIPSPEPGSIPWIELHFGAEAAYQAGLGVWGNSGFSPNQQYLVNNFEGIAVLYELAGKLATFGHDGYDPPEGYVGEWAKDFRPSDVNNLANKMLGTALIIQEHERVDLGLIYPPPESPVTTLLAYGLQGRLSEGGIDYILRHLPVDYLKWLDLYPNGVNPDTGEEAPAYLVYFIERYDLSEYI
jgi:hypothetical protein